MIDTRTADHKSTLLHHMTTLWNPTPSTTHIIAILSSAASATKFCFKTTLAQCKKKQEDLTNINKWITGYTKSEGSRIVEVLLPFLEVTSEKLMILLSKLRTPKKSMTHFQNISPPMTLPLNPPNSPQPFQPSKLISKDASQEVGRACSAKSHLPI